MSKENAIQDWGIKIYPIRNKQCLQRQCAWWLEEDKMRAIKKINSKREG